MIEEGKDFSSISNRDNAEALDPSIFSPKTGSA